MDFEKFERDVRSIYKKSRASTPQKRLEYLFAHIKEEWSLEPQDLSVQELKIISEVVMELQTESLQKEVEELLAEKERIERQLDRKSDLLQKEKHDLFNAIEAVLSETGSEKTIAKLHQIKLQSVDLFDMLSEMTESAVITTLERGSDVEETLEEVIKEITYNTLNEGALNNIRIRKILSTILDSVTDVAEATPNNAEMILHAALRGARSGLIRAIDRFKQQLLYLPEELKNNLDDFTMIQEELYQTEALFNQVVQALANNRDAVMKESIERVAASIRYDMDELVHISKETVHVMKDRFNVLAKAARERSVKMLNSETAKEAKRMGVQAFSVAKSALDNALKNAKEKIEKK